MCLEARTFPESNNSLFPNDRKVVKLPGGKEQFKKTDQQASDGGKQVNGVVINFKRWTGGHRFTCGVSLQDKRQI